MGLKPHHQDANYLIDERKDEGYEAVHVSCMLYDSSWDWLMPVVDKIEDAGLDPHEMILNSLTRNKQKKWRSIEDTYNVAVYLIKTHNDGNARTS